MDDRSTREIVGWVALGVELALLPGLFLAVVQMATDGDVLCPTDASCSAPVAPVALIGAPLRWRMGLLLPVLVVLAGAVAAVVVAAALYRVDVPRP